MRYAIRYTTLPDAEARVMARYLPSNYTVTTGEGQHGTAVIIEGTDNAGWTLDGYVLERLASGWYHAREITEEQRAQFRPLTETAVDEPLPVWAPDKSQG